MSKLDIQEEPLSNWSSLALFRLSGAGTSVELKFPRAVLNLNSCNDCPRSVVEEDDAFLNRAHKLSNE